MPQTLTSATCLVCRSRHSYALGHWENMPLSVLALPRTRDEALAMTGYTLDMRRCAECGHVFNSLFDYERVPYEEASNLVFNNGRFWVEYQERLAARWMERYDIRGKVVAEIGSGDGRFLELFAAGNNECLAWEPGPDADRCRARGLRAYREYFRPEHLGEHRPDVILCRHVLEHLPDPLAFLGDLRRGCIANGLRPLFLAEVPRIDKALEQERVSDFLYEHVSHFTNSSFETLFDNAGFRVVAVESGYGDEVITLAAVPRRQRAVRRARRVNTGLEEPCSRFVKGLATQARDVDSAFARWAAADLRVALWGATGKGAAMTNFFGLTADRAPLVVDSDARKVGFYVPGTAQRIMSPQVLVDDGVDVILICTQWRARDIEYEIRERWKLDAKLFVHHRGSVLPLTASLKL